jgi:hypothetical protein
MAGLRSLPKRTPRKDGEEIEQVTYLALPTGRALLKKIQIRINFKPRNAWLL